MPFRAILFLLHICITIAASAQEKSGQFDFQTKPFYAIKHWPQIKDSAFFIRQLKLNCHLEEQNTHNKKEAINYFRKIHLAGSAKEYYLIEYDFHDGANAEFPWKKQILFDKDGKLIKVLSAIRVDVVKIFPHKSAFLFTVSSTAHGNGWHAVYRIRQDTLIQVYDGFIGRRPQTYCTGRDNERNIPIELHHRFYDANKDGYNDIIFYGQVYYIPPESPGGPAKTIPVTYIFLYNPKNGHFSEKEDYSEKYKFIYGDTK